MQFWECEIESTSANGLVYSTSTDGVNWSAVTPVPIDDVSSTRDHIIAGMGIDPATSGASAHVGIAYSYYPQTNCTSATCQLFVGFIASAKGGAPWNAPVTLTGAMELSWLAKFAVWAEGGKRHRDHVQQWRALRVFAVARQNSGRTFAEAVYTEQGLTVTATGKQFSVTGGSPVTQTVE